ncbi:MAG TPA: SPASM domain-containing protein [bacterium]|nr:SPASM domain-containing protein [bacterium]
MTAVIMKSNYREIGKMLDFAREYRFDLVKLYYIHGTRAAGENIFLEEDPAAMEYLCEMMPFFKKKAADYGLVLDSRLPVPGIKKYRKNGKKQLLCHRPWQSISIDYWGNVWPDVFCWDDGWKSERMPGAGNVFKSSIGQIWNGKGMQEYRRRIVQRECRGICNPECLSGLIPEKTRKLNV